MVWNFLFRLDLFVRHCLLHTCGIDERILCTIAFCYNRHNGKNISIGIASSGGKAWIHSAGTTKDVSKVWGNLPEQDNFLESMAEAAKAVTDHCGDKILYISVANNLSVDCDCDSSPEDPRMGDIGILASLDPVALDRACTDLVRSSEDHGKIHLIERIDSRHGMHTLDYAEQLGMGSQKYELVELK